MADLSSLLSSSRQLTSHITRPNLPQINLGLDQIEKQSRRLATTQPPAQDPSKANFLLAQAQINAPTLSSQIASLNTQTTFAPLQPLSDTDVPSFLRHAHEQSLISAIEEGRRETENEFYRVLEERVRRDWEVRKKKIFEELGVASAVTTSIEREGGQNAFGKSRAGAPGLSASRSAKSLAGTVPSQGKQALPMHHKMMAYDGVITQLNNSRRATAPFPLVNSLIETARTTSQSGQNRTIGEQFIQILQILSNIVEEQPALPVSHAQAHLLNNARVRERHFASVYLGNPSSNSARELRQKIVDGARKYLEDQYWIHLQKLIDMRLQEAAVGGDPSLANKVRGFLSVRFYKGGRWEERLEIVAAKPLWAQIFYLVRTGHYQEALGLAQDHEKQLNDREPNFVTFLRTWIENDRRMPRQHLDRLISSYNSRIAFAAGQNDPFKAALFKLMGKIEPHKKSLGIVASTTEDWIWFQLMMIDEQVEAGAGFGLGGIDSTAGGTGLRDLADVLESYGERHFAGEPAGLSASVSFLGGSPSSTPLAGSALGGSSGVAGQTNASKKASWARLLLICGMFEKAVAALYEHPELQIEAVHLGIALSYYGLLRVPSREEISEVDILISSPTRPSALNFALLIARYIRQFQKTDPKEALQYAYCVALHSERQTRPVGSSGSTLLSASGSSSLFRPNVPAITSSNAEDADRDGKYHLEIARDLVRSIIIECDGRWDELVGGFKADGSKYDGILKHDLPLLRLSDVEYTDVILMQAAQQCEASRKLLDAIKLYNLAGAQDTVMSCLSRALGELLSEPGGGGEEGRELEELARSVLHYYENTNPTMSGTSGGSGEGFAAAVLGTGSGRLGRDGEDVKKLIRVRWAMEAYEKGDLEAALNAIEQSQLVSLDGDIQTISRKMDEFKAMDPSITRNLGEILILAMNILHGIHSRTKNGLSTTDRDDKLSKIRKRARALMTFAGMQKYSLSADVYGQLTRLEVMIAH